jgi:cardiolipin synthase
MLRICLVPLLVMAVLQRRFPLAFGIFLIAAVTDAMDGLLARMLRQHTRLGQYLDPIADKLLLSSLFLVFTSMGILEPYIAVIVFGRDIGMLLVAGILYKTTSVRDFHPTFLGKANSFSQVVAVGVVLLSLIPDQPWGMAGIATARAVALNTTILLTVASGFHYALVASKRIGLAGDHDLQAQILKAHSVSPAEPIEENAELVEQD